MSRKFRLHDGKKGSALAVRVTPRAARNQVVGVLNDGTIKVHLDTTPEDDEMNRTLVEFIAGMLGVAKSRIEIVAGESGRDKLVSVLEMSTEDVHKKVIEELGKN